MATIGYARVSTDDQSSDSQVDALEHSGAGRVFVETASGANTARPQLAACLEYLRAGDVLAVVRLDRLGRSLRHLIETIDTLGDRDVEFRSLTEGVDTTTSGGRLVFSIFGAIAEFERALIRERTMAGLDEARRQGRVGGRPPKMDDAKLDAARTLRQTGLSMRTIGDIIGVSASTVSRHL